MEGREPIGGQMTLVDHLSELRNRLIRSIVAILAGAVVAYIFYDPILDFLLEPHCQLNAGAGIADDCALLAISPLEGFSAKLMVATYTGLAIAMPVVLWQVWRFIAPGLYSDEKGYALAFVALSFVLFALGAGLAYWSMPRALEFLVDVGGERIEAFYRPREYIGFIVKMMVGFGIGFEFPIVLIFLQLIGLIDNQLLRSGRRFAVVGIVVLVAVLTPSGDPVSLLALSVPMYLFYEVAIVFGWWRARRQRKAATKAPV